MKFFNNFRPILTKVRFNQFLPSRRGFFSLNTSQNSKNIFDSVKSKISNIFDGQMMRAKKDLSEFKTSFAFPDKTKEDAEKYIFQSENGQLNKDFSGKEDSLSAKLQFQLVFKVFLLRNDKKLLENLIDLNYNYEMNEKIPKINRTILEYAVYEHGVSAETLKTLIGKTKVDVNHFDKSNGEFKRPIIHWAAQSSGPYLAEKIRILIENGANVNAFFNGKTALDILAGSHDDERRNNIESIKILASHGTIIEKSDLAKLTYRDNGLNNSPRPHKRELAKFFEEFFNWKPKIYESKVSRRKLNTEEAKKLSPRDTPIVITRARRTKYVG